MQLRSGLIFRWLMIMVLLLGRAWAQPPVIQVDGGGTGKSSYAINELIYAPTSTSLEGTSDHMTFDGVTVKAGQGSTGYGGDAADLVVSDSYTDISGPSQASLEINTDWSPTVSSTGKSLFSTFSDLATAGSQNLGFLYGNFLSVSHEGSGTVSQVYGIEARSILDVTSGGATSWIYGGRFQARDDAPVDNNSASYGVWGEAWKATSNTGFQAHGVLGQTTVKDSATLTSGSGVSSQINLLDTGTISTAYGFNLNGVFKAAGATITTLYGFYCPDLSIEGAGTAFNFYSEGVNSTNFFEGTITSPGSADRTEKFGDGAGTGTALDATALGNGATVSDGSDDGTATGAGSSVTAVRGTAYGHGATAGSANSVAVGVDANASSGANGIAIGRLASTSAANQFVVGSASSNIREVYIGRGVTASTPMSVTFFGTSASGTDISASGSDMIFVPSRGTGTGAGAHYLVRVAPAGATGSSLNTLITALEITDSLTAQFGSSTDPVEVSAPGSGTETERFGAGADTGTREDCTAVGAGALANVDDNATAFGSGATATARNSTACGVDAQATGATSASVFGAFSTATADNAQSLGSFIANSSTNGIAVGNAITISGTNTVALGYDLEDGGNNRALLLGSGARATGDNQVVFGATSDPLLDYFIGRGTSHTEASPGTATIRATSAVAASGDPGMPISIRPGAGDGAGADGTGDLLDASGASVLSWSAGSATFGSSGSVEVSSPGSGANSERYGSGADTGTAVRATAVGNGAAVGDGYDNGTAVGHLSTVTAAGGTALGYNTTAGFLACVMGQGSTGSGSGSVALGEGTSSTGIEAISLGSDASCTIDMGMSLGSNSSASGTTQSAIALGSGATSVDGIALGRGSSAAAFEFGIGGDNGEIRDVYIGKSAEDDAPPTTVTIHTTSAAASSGANGTSIAFRPGSGEGAGTDGTGDLEDAGGTSVLGWSAGFLDRGTGVFDRYSTTAGITASTTQSQGQQPLTSAVNEIATVANPGDVITAPSGSAGIRFVVINNGANDLSLYPASGDDLGAGVDTLVTVSAGTSAEYVFYDSTNGEAL